MRYYWKKRAFWAAAIALFLAGNAVLRWFLKKSQPLAPRDSAGSASAAVAAAANALFSSSGGSQSGLEESLPVPAPQTAATAAGQPLLKPPPRPEAAAAPVPASAPKAPSPEAEEGATKCRKPAAFGALTVPTRAGRQSATAQGLDQELLGRTLTWCHDGVAATGQFTLEKGGLTGGDFPRWGLKAWKAVGEHEVKVHSGIDTNVHSLIFNCDHTGFIVRQSRQRGYIDGFDSPDSAFAPTTDELPDCRNEVFAPSKRLPVWIMWDFPRGVPTSFRMNLRSYRKHLKEDIFELHLVNASNIRKYLPGVPGSYFHLYNGAKSDFLRAGLLAVHGGVYIDGDIMLMHDMDITIKDLLDGKVDFLAYEGPGDRCPNSYTTNFHAAVKGNLLSSQWINNTLAAMRGRCSLDESQNYREPVKVCCFKQDWCIRNECHVAWGDLSHPPALNQLPKDSVRFGCVPYKTGMSTTMNGNELYYTLSKTSTDKRQHCWPEGASDLHCTSPVGKLPGFFDRHGHHLYNMLKGGTLEEQSEEEVLSSKLVIGELYRRSLGLTASG